MIRTQPKRLFDQSKEYVIAQNNVLPTYNGKNLLNVKPVTERIDFFAELMLKIKSHGIRIIQL